MLGLMLKDELLLIWQRHTRKSSFAVTFFVLTASAGEILTGCSNSVWAQTADAIEMCEHTD